MPSRPAWSGPTLGPVTTAPPLPRPSDAAFSLLVGQGLLAVGVVRRGVLESATPKLVDLFGLRREAWPVTFGSLVADVDRERLRTALASLDPTAGAEPSSLSVGFDARRADGSVFEAELVAASGELDAERAVVVLVTDVTERRRAEKQLSYLAFLDPLTGLPNRALFLDRLRETLMAARRDRRVFSVLMCDLDGFKQVNDTFGHEAGDTVLSTVARRFEAAVRESDTVARLGGDELAALLPRVARREDAAIVAGRMVRALAEPISLGASSCKVGVSIGVATYPADGLDIDGLLARADAAMYESKRAGKNRFTYAEPAVEGANEVLSLPFVHFGPSHEVGVVLIDAQHRGLVDLLNGLGDDLKRGRERDAILGSLGALVTFTVKHFASEEALMREHPGWPLETRHVEEHKKLVDDVTSLTLQIDSRSMAITMRFLQEWLVRHIDTLDKPLGVWLREHGVA